MKSVVQVIFLAVSSIILAANGSSNNVPAQRSVNKSEECKDLPSWMKKAQMKGPLPQPGDPDYDPYLQLSVYDPAPRQSEDSTEEESKGWTLSSE